MNRIFTISFALFLAMIPVSLSLSFPTYAVEDPLARALECIRAIKQDWNNRLKIYSNAPNSEALHPSLHWSSHYQDDLGTYQHQFSLGAHLLPNKKLGAHLTVRASVPAQAILEDLGSRQGLTPLALLRKMFPHTEHNPFRLPWFDAFAYELLYKDSINLAVETVATYDLEEVGRNSGGVTLRAKKYQYRVVMVWVSADRKFHIFDSGSGKLLDSTQSIPRPDQFSVRLNWVAPRTILTGKEIGVRSIEIRDPFLLWGNSWTGISLPGPIHYDRLNRQRPSGQGAFQSPSLSRFDISNTHFSVW